MEAVDSSSLAMDLPPVTGLQMVYHEFLESIAALACFVYKNPYLPLETKIDNFIQQVLMVRPLPPPLFSFWCGLLNCFALGVC